MTRHTGAIPMLDRVSRSGPVSELVIRESPSRKATRASAARCTRPQTTRSDAIVASPADRGSPRRSRNLRLTAIAPSPAGMIRFAAAAAHCTEVDTRMPSGSPLPARSATPFVT